MTQRFSWVALVVLGAAGCAGNTGGDDMPDAGTWRPDARPIPDYRDRCTGEGGVSGVSGDGGCGDGSVWMPDAGVDAGPPPPPCNEVTFEYDDPSAVSVWVTGTFTDPEWAETPAEGALELEDDGTGTWTITTLIEPYGTHEYKFVVDGDTWVPDPENPERVDDTFGGYNSVIHVCTTACGDVEDFDWRDSVMYFVMVDRFYDSDGSADPVSGVSDGDASTGPSGQYEGGDLQGVIAKLPYLADLGVTSLWLSAPYENRDSAGAAIDPGSDSHTYSGYHGYWPSPPDIDYSGTDPSPRPEVESRIGTEADLRSLVEMAHGTTGADGHGMKVLFDYVMNHVDIDSGLYSAHPDWFATKTDGSFALCGPEGLWEDPYWGTRCAFTDYLPPFDYENAAARAWSIDDALWWARELGIDGYRLDAIKHVPLVWLTDLRERLNADIADPAGDRFYLVGETFAYDNRDLIRSFVDADTMLDGQFDFPFKARLCEAAFTPDGSLETFSTWMDGNDGFYGAGSIMTTWIGNHDIPRAIHFASREITNCREGSNPGNGWDWRPSQPTDAAPYERLGVAFAVMFTNPGIPLIYYGDEVGLAGGGDPDNRRTMPWSDSELNAHQRALRDRVAKLGEIRGTHPVLGRGRRITLSASQDTWVYRMTGCDSAGDVVVAINRADGARDVTLPSGSWVDLMTDTAHSGGTVSLGARSFLVLETM